MHYRRPQELAPEARAALRYYYIGLAVLIYLVGGFCASFLYGLAAATTELIELQWGRGFRTFTLIYLAMLLLGLAGCGLAHSQSKRKDKGA